MLSLQSAPSNEEQNVSESVDKCVNNYCITKLMYLRIDFLINTRLCMYIHTPALLPEREAIHPRFLFLPTCSVL